MPEAITDNHINSKVYCIIIKLVSSGGLVVKHPALGTKEHRFDPS